MAQPETGRGLREVAMEIWITVGVLGSLLALPVLGKVFRKLAAVLQDRKTKTKLIPALEMADLSEVQTDLNLRAGERCYFTASASLVTEKNVRRRAAYHGPVVRIKLAPGISYRAAMVLGGRGYKKRWVKSSDGKLYLTNRRIIFRGKSRNNSCDFSEILELQWFTNRVVRIDKQAGPPFILADVNARLVGYYVDRLSGAKSNTL
jgi:hypothetical protein